MRVATKKWRKRAAIYMLLLSRNQADAANEFRARFKRAGKLDAAIAALKR